MLTRAKQIDFAELVPAFIDFLESHSTEKQYFLDLANKVKPIRVVTDDYIIDPETDYTISVNNGETESHNITLPDASLFEGYIFIIKRYDANSEGVIFIDAVNAATHGVQDATGSIDVAINLPPTKSFRQMGFQSNGSFWELISA